MSQNLNSGYGQHVAAALHGVSPGGQVFVVAKTAAAGRQILQDLFQPEDGINRYFATLEEAINAATASRGDVIFLAPGHTEGHTGSSDLRLDKAGLKIVGLGHGSARPTFSYNSDTGSTFRVSAADIEIENCIFRANFADVTAAFTLTTANNFKLKNCRIDAAGSGLNFLYVVNTDAVTSNADGLTVEGCEWIDADTATESFVKLDGDNYDVKLINNYVSLGVNNNTPALMAIATGKSAFNAQIIGNKVYRLNTDTATGAILVTTDQSDNSGVISGNFAQHADTASELLVTASSGFGLFQNYASGVAGASGYLLPASDS